MVICPIETLNVRLGYWMVFGVFHVIDLMNAVVLKVIPHYYLFKLATLMYLMTPKVLPCMICII